MRQITQNIDFCFQCSWRKKLYSTEFKHGILFCGFDPEHLRRTFNETRMDTIPEWCPLIETKKD